MGRGKPRHDDLPFTPMQIRLLVNVLDAIDRLYDNSITVLDLYAIILATSAAMLGTDLHELLTSTSGDLLRISQSDSTTSETSRGNALEATDPLRKRLAGLIPFPD